MKQKVKTFLVWGIIIVVVILAITGGVWGYIDWKKRQPVKTQFATLAQVGGVSPTVSKTALIEDKNDEQDSLKTVNVLDNIAFGQML